MLPRAHYMPLFSRLGPYDRSCCTGPPSRRPRRLFEYWAHEAALVDVKLWQAFQFRMDSGARMWGNMARIIQDKPEFVAWVLDEVRENGPFTAREVEHDAPRDKDNWGWNWSEVKMALEYLFYKGQVTAARRNSAFERVYDLPERVIPQASLDEPPLDPELPTRVLVSHAAGALGVGTAQCLRDYFRMAPEPTKAAIEDLVETGRARSGHDLGLEASGLPARDAVRPRKVRRPGAAQPVRPPGVRAHPHRAALRLPLPDRDLRARRTSAFMATTCCRSCWAIGSSARVDLKADRQSGSLLVHGAWAESHAPAETADELAAELWLMAGWLGLETVTPPTRAIWPGNSRHRLLVT